ncbi:hypothetical protein BJ322DRAFT_786856 [Thelephora terrestris]|uniref:Uncharacterized protein n=1 Tax=Thelephora terrestris TaxID=56493 RepID=A0A9P6HJ58_9AGAM|nr:hypothetical protein BJ322DRAFT_786856 [Thelephora terrestris]
MQQLRMHIKHDLRVVAVNLKPCASGHSARSDRKSKKPYKPPTDLLLGITANIAVSPLGFRAVLDINPKDENNPAPSQIIPCERESGAQEPPVPGPSNYVTMPDIEQGPGRPTGGLGGHRREDRLAMEPKVPEQDHRSKTAITPVIRTDIQEQPASGFGLLKSLLKAISTDYANHEESAAVEKTIEGLLSRVTSMDALFSTLPGDVAEQRRRDEVIRELKGIEGKLQSLTEEPGSSWPINHAKHDEDVFSLLEDLREVILCYQMVRRTRINNQEFKSIDPGQNPPCIPVLNDSWLTQFLR